MQIEYLDQEGTFTAAGTEREPGLYFPLTGPGGVMANITPGLAGDSKLEQHQFLLEPVSIEDIRTKMVGRNVWLRLSDGEIWDIAGTSAGQVSRRFGDEADRVTVTAGKLWHQVSRTNERLGLCAEVLNYCPATAEQVEIMRVTFTNTGTRKLVFTPVTAIPLYGRSADNIRDHRHVTALLHRIQIGQDGITVTPAMRFDERGHRTNDLAYSVFAAAEGGEHPVKFYPVREDFIGPGGTPCWPEAVVRETTAGVQPGSCIAGYEAFGGLEFAPAVLLPGESKEYIILLSYDKQGRQYLDAEQEKAAFVQMQEYWRRLLKVRCTTADDHFDQWAGWVGIQPELRRIYGCSFMPHHDYGRGGRGWRDLWQDSLALLLMDPESVRPLLVSYFGGVRIDGSNATIIGRRPGEFIADRNAIVRVWMDHGLWPFITLREYLEMTGDYGILLESQSYFKDGISHRGEERDSLWDGSGKTLQSSDGKTYSGTIIEHLLVQHLTIFFDAGEHNHLRLRGADWNDALDMAAERGESVAFTAAYSGNLIELAAVLEQLGRRQRITELQLAEELLLLISQPPGSYHDSDARRAVLKQYCSTCAHQITGKVKQVRIADLVSDLSAKAAALQENIRRSEWLTDSSGRQWFNSYYDNSGRQVEGEHSDHVRVMLTGQVFTVMSGTATDEQVARICRTVDHYLYDREAGGYRLNTDFGEVKTDLGRMFGFAYGHKENGAVFSHMAVMYAYALYKRGFAKEGYRAIKALYSQASDFEKSGIFPGIPEYFDDRGRGMYHYLTGAASWMLLTILTRMFGIRGREGDLSLSPGLLREQFDEYGQAAVTCGFGGQRWKIIYENIHFKEIGDYDIEEMILDGRTLSEEYAGRGIIPAEYISSLERSSVHELRVILA